MASLRWSLALPTEQVEHGPDLVSAPAVAEMAVALEAAGVDACHVTDHPYPPAEWVAAGGHHALDPLVTLAVAATATSRLLLHTNAYIAAYRHPVLAAHGIATLDAMSGGRVILGLASGYLRPEFESLGVEFHERGVRLDAAVAAMKDAWRGLPGARGNVLRPVPVSRPHPPIWFGGNSPVVIRRVVATGQGWMPFPASAGLARAVRTSELADHGGLARAISSLRTAAEVAGRTEPIDICCAPFSHPHHLARLEPERLLDEAATLRALGVTWLSIRLAAPSRSGYLENVQRFATEVLGKC